MQGIPIIAISAGGKDAQERALTCGVDIFLRKLVKFAERVASEVRQVRGAADVGLSTRGQKPELEVQVNAEGRLVVSLLPEDATFREAVARLARRVAA